MLGELKSVIAQPLVQSRTAQGYFSGAIKLFCEAATNVAAVGAVRRSVELRLDDHRSSVSFMWP